MQHAKHQSDESSLPIIHVEVVSSLAQETYSYNGSPKCVHVILKNSPCVVHLAAIPDTSIDLRRASLSAVLVYDDNEVADPRHLRTVNFVKKEPMEFFASAEEHGKASVELRLNVLTSQHEDSLFRVLFTAQDCGFTSYAVTDPLKVVAKADSVTRPGRSKQSRASKRLMIGADNGSPSADSQSERKRTRLDVGDEDRVYKCLEAMREEQRTFLQHQQQQLSDLYNAATFKSTSTPLSSSLASRFCDLMRALEELSPQERQMQLQRSVTSYMAQSRSSVTLLSDLVLRLSVALPTVEDTSSDCSSPSLFIFGTPNALDKDPFRESDNASC